MNPRWSALLFGVLLLAGCGPGSTTDPEPPENVLSKDSFAHLYAEAQLIEAAGKHGMFREDDPDIRLAAAYAELFARTGVSEERYRAIFAWWFNHPEALTEVLALSTDYLNDLERKETGVRYVPAPVDSAGKAPAVTKGKTLRPRKAVQSGN